MPHVDKGTTVYRGIKKDISQNYPKGKKFRCVCVYVCVCVCVYVKMSSIYILIPLPQVVGSDIDDAEFGDSE